MTSAVQTRSNQILDADLLLADRIERANQHFKVLAECLFDRSKDLYGAHPWCQRGDVLERICYRGTGCDKDTILVRVSFCPGSARSIRASENNLTDALYEGDNWVPHYSKWRHGGWYVHNVRHINGGCGCVSNNYPDKKWRIVCDDRRTELNEEGDFTFRTRDAAAQAERALAREEALEYCKGLWLSVS